MTLKSRNFLIASIFLLLCACAGLLVFILTQLNIGNAAIQETVARGSAQYLQWSWPLSSQTPYINLVSPAISIMLAWTVAIVFLRYFRKVTSPQLFFLVLFWVSMGVEIVRALNLLFVMYGASLLQQQILTRLAILGRIFGAMSLFAASLYLVGTKLKHQGTILVVISFLSVCLANLVPLDSDAIGQDLLFLPAAGYSLDSLRLVAGLLTILNFIKHAVSSRDRENLWLVFAILSLIAGLELQYMATDWILTALSWLLLAIGTAWLGRRFINNYMWY